MPTEPYSWDRRDFRKNERSGSDGRFGGGGGFGGGGPQRWREQNNHHPHGAPPPYHQHHNNHQQNQRWYSDFRSSRPLPPGHGKQGGWNMYPDEGGHGFLPFGSRYGDRNAEEENCRPFNSRSDGRYFRNNRENRGCFSQKDSKSSSSSSKPAPSQKGHMAPTTDVNNQRSEEINTQTCHQNNEKNNGDDPSRSLPESFNPLDQSQSLVKVQHAVEMGATDGTSGSVQKIEKENSMGSIDWKPFKWTRSESLSSRGSGFSHSCSSKSMGVDSVEMVVDVQEKNVTPIQSPLPPPPPAAATCVIIAPAATLDSSDESGSRKKPRLGWGEGLAKYEKKKVEGPEDGGNEQGLVISCNTESMPSHFVDKSPRVTSFTDCASPATPSSVACSSSPGIDEKESVKVANVDHSMTNLSCSPSVMSQSDYEGPTFNLENFDSTSIASLSSLINELPEPDDPSSVEISYVRTTLMNKLLLLKVDILKAIEMTESEVDSLETELKSLVSEPRSCCTYPAASSSLPGDCHLRTSDEQATASNFTTRPTPLQVISSGDVIVKNAPAAVEEGHIGSKSVEIDSPGTATPKLVENSFPYETAVGVESSMNLDANNSSDLEDKCLKNDISEEATCLLDDRNPAAINCQDISGPSNVHYDVYDTFLSIYASNKDSFGEASESLNKLLPAQQCLFDISTTANVSSLQRDSSVMKELILKRKRSLQFREKVITVKFKVFQHFWKEGRMLSVRKLRVKSHKKFDLSQTGIKKNRSSRSRITFSVGSSRTVPAEEVIEFVNGLLSESSFKPYRNSLKMPALILDKETKMSQFISNNGLVEDPCAVEKERSTYNKWTAKDREIFIDKLATFGKDFKKMSSFFENKTIADCVEFYYKNHKLEWFERGRKKLGGAKQKKSQPNTYLVASGKRGVNRETSAASIDMLGAIAANNVDDGVQNQQKPTSKITFGASSSWKALPRNDDGPLQRSNSLDMSSSETVAADVLAGICGTLSSEAMSSCITTSVDPSDGYHHDWRSQRVGSYARRPLTPDVTQIVVEDDEYSDESCGEMTDYTDWTDHEKSMFINAVSSYGKDFVMISQRVGTRSRDQCKIFFSKSRKCLGLDRFLPGVSNGGDCNGGGDSDIEDGCVVEIGSGSVTSNEEDLHSPGTKLSNESDDVLGTKHNLEPDFKICEENDGKCARDDMLDESVLKNSSLKDTQVDDKPVKDNGACVSVQEVKNVDASFNTETAGGVDDDNDKSLPNGSSEAENNGLGEISGGRREENEEQEFVNKNVEDRDNANSSEVQLAESISPVAHSSLQVDTVSGLHSVGKSRAISPGQNGLLDSMESSSLFSVPIKYQGHSSSNGLFSVGTDGINDKQPQNIVMAGDCFSGHSPLGRVESSQILRGYPVSVQTVKDINGDVNYKKPVPINVPKRDSNLQPNHHLEFFLQKCNGSGHQTTRAIDACPFEEQRREHSRTQLGYSSDADRPPRNGDVKLFGKILVSSQQKPNSCSKSDDNSQHHKVNDSSKLKFDCNNYPALENIPVRNSGFWGANGSQTGFPSLPLDSSLLLTKYPTAFSSNHVPAVKLVQPFSIDMRQQHSQDVLFSEMQRRNGFNVVSAFQQQGRINVVGRNGVLVGGQCSGGVSDPVTAIKMHYANAENFSVRMKEDDTWRNNGDIGR